MTAYAELQDGANSAVPADPPASATGPSLTRLAITGGAWTAAGHGAGQMLRLISNVILARLLFPEAFGLMALVMALMAGLDNFSDVGISTSIIRCPDGDRRGFLNTAWTLQVVRGFVLWLLACVLAWPMARLYQQPLLASLIPVMGLTALLQGLYSTSLIRLRRDMSFRALTLLDLGAQAAAVVTMVGWALIHRSVWALAAGTLVANTIRLIVSHIIAIRQGRDGIGWDRPAARELLSFGKWIFLSTVLSFVVANADRFVFGKIGAMSWLGTYSIALTLATMPTVVIIQVGGAVTFPAFSRVQTRGGDLAGAFRRSRLPLLMAGGLLVTGLIVAGPSAVAMLYDKRYQGAGAILQLLSIGCWFQVLEVTNGAMLLTIGDATMVALGNGVKLAVMVAGMTLGYHLAGVQGAIVGLVAGDAGRYVTSAWAVWRRGMGCVGMDSLLTLLVAAGSVGSLALLGLLPPHLPGERVTRFLISSVPPVLVWTGPAAAVAWEFWKSHRRRRTNLPAPALTTVPS